ncbi:MAG TPA: DUF929 family protein [Mycobacteriales bacterium]|nr:DUF929 family protein [Mycobacteriales bacterium]
MGRETNKQRRERQAGTAREKAAAARAVQARVDQRRRAKTILSSVIGAAVVIALIAVFAITSGGGKQSAGGNRTDAAASVVSAVTSVEQASLDQVGEGAAQMTAKAINDAPLTKDGKPELFGVLAEFCPYCAAERWPLIVALSKFGTFNDLKTVRSSSTDVDPNTATFSFYKSSYTSKYLAFTPIENEDRTGQPLEDVTDAQKAIWFKYSQGFPFLDFGGKYVVTGPSFSPGDLKDLNWAQISDQLKDPTSKVAQDILGEANVFTAMICKMTNGQPSSVCSASGVTKINLPTQSA